MPGSTVPMAVMAAVELATTHADAIELAGSERRPHAIDGGDGRLWARTVA